MLARIALSLLLAASCSACLGTPRGPEPSAAAPMTPRASMTRALGRIQVGMTAEEARRVLGAPDDVITEDDPGGLGTTGTREIWGYGASGHLEFPTSGQVFIDEQERVQYVFGGRGAPPPPSLLADDEIRALLRVLARVPSDDFGYDPLPVIRAVNALQPLGKERALAAIGELLRVASWRDRAREGMFLVLRVLFDVPKEGVMPRMVVGVRSPQADEDSRRLARYPIVLAGDIPFVLYDAYFSAGGRPQPEDHVAYFRAAGVLRSAPLHPAADPLAALDAIERHLVDPSRRAHCRNQAVVMLDSIHRVEPDIHGMRFSWGDDTPARWADLRRAVAGLHPRWDDRLGLYTFADGTTLPVASEVPRRRVRWSFDVPGVKGRVTLQRRSRRFVGVSVCVENSPNTAPAPLTVRVVDVTGGGRRILVETTFEWPPSGRATGNCHGTVIELAPGAEVVVERTAGSEVKSEVLRP